MSTELLLRQAVSLHQAGKLAEAERLYAEVLAAERGHFQAQYLLGFLLYQQQRHAEALPAIEAALALNPEAREALGLHGILLLAAGEHARALESVTKLLAHAPEDADALHNRGVILAGMRRLDEALESFDRALALKPGHAGTHYHRGNALLDLNRHEDAVAAFDRMLTRMPNSFEGWSNRGLALYELERFADSLASYDRALALRPDRAAAWINRGKALNNLRRLDEALASYDKALALAPESAEAWHTRAHSLRTMYRYDDALASLDKALALQPGTAPLLFTRGWVTCEQGRIADGLELIRQTAASETVDAPGPAHKQRHDAEQRDYLAAQGVQPGDAALYFAGGEALPGAVINPDNVPTATAAWEKSRPQIVVIDNFLTPEALTALRRFCWGSTVWRKPYPNGYLGAFPEQGFACPLLAQIAEGLRDTFPGIIGDHRLRMLWGFKYDSNLRGIEIHADQAAVNVNFWITADEANTNAESGGMVIWDVAAPEDWGAKRYNGDDAAARDFLARTGAKAMTVPHRANRAVVFDLDLFHKTDAIDFEEGYLNRRINVTMLYGRRTYYGA